MEGIEVVHFAAENKLLACGVFVCACKLVYIYVMLSCIEHEIFSKQHETMIYMALLCRNDIRELPAPSLALLDRNQKVNYRENIEEIFHSDGFVIQYSLNHAES